MDIEPLKTYLDNSHNKKLSLLLFLTNDIKKLISNCNLVDEVYLNDNIYLIKRNTLKLEIIGKIFKIDDDNIYINKRGNQSCVCINKNKYYIFIKPIKNKNNDRIFYETLLKVL